MKLVNDNFKCLFIRHNEKVTLECELAELRKNKNTEWEKTKHHLKLAKSKTSLLNMHESFEQDNNKEAKDIDSASPIVDETESRKKSLV